MHRDIELIILVEDDRHEAELFLTVIRRMGLSSFVRVYSNGSDAANDILSTNYESFPVSLFVLDINLPDIAGTSLYDLIKGKVELCDSKIAFLTHVPSRRVKELKAEDPEIALFKKPASIAAYEDTIQKILAFAEQDLASKVA